MPLLSLAFESGDPVKPMPEALPPEWSHWVEENLAINPRCGGNLLLRLLDRGFHPLPSLDAVGDALIILEDEELLISQVEICVLVASYRDPECVPTLTNLFAQARWPGRVSVALVSQEEPVDRLKLTGVLATWRKQISIHRSKASQSQGVCWARHQCQKLLKNQKFILQIDSHMRFEQGWDVLLLATWLHCRDPKAVLTAYPAGYQPNGEIQLGVFHGMVAKNFDKDGVLLFTGKPRFVDGGSAPSRPLPGAFVSANFLFGPAKLVQDVPYDPRLYFFGEEVTLSVRLWTHGFNIYHPNRAILYHFWDRAARTTHFADHPDWIERDRLSKSRVRALLGVPAHEGDGSQEGFGQFGLGDVRSLAEYERWSGICFGSLSIARSASLGQFPAPGAQAFNPDARAVLELDDLLVIDDFLPSEDYLKLREFLVCSDYKHINTSGSISRAWHLQDRFPLRSDKSWIMRAAEVGEDKPDWVVPTGTPIDGFMRAVESFQADRVPCVGQRGEAWDEFSATSWIYPPGTSLAMHTDGVNVYTGAYVYFLNDAWRSHWGGLLVVMDPTVNAYVSERESAQDGQRWYRRRWLHENELEELILESSALGRCVFPKANRIAFLGNAAYHMVTRVNEEAGDCVRLSLAGFFRKRKS